MVEWRVLVVEVFVHAQVMKVAASWLEAVFVALAAEVSADLRVAALSAASWLVAVWVQSVED